MARNHRSFLMFHLEHEVFAYYQPVKMKDDPLSIDVTELMKQGNAGLGGFVARLGADPGLAPKLGAYVGRLSRLLGVTDIDLHIEEVTGRTSPSTWWSTSSTGWTAVERSSPRATSRWQGSAPTGRMPAAR